MKTILALMVLASAVGGAKLDIGAYAERSRVEREQAAIQTRVEIEQLKKNRKITNEERKQLVQALTRKLRELDNPLTPFYPPVDLRAGKVGDIGMFHSDEGRVIQVMDNTTALVELRCYSSGERYARAGEGAARIGVKRTEHARLVMLKGYDTSGMTDDSRVTLSGVFGFTGTETYETDGGTNTVAVLEAAGITPHTDQFTRRHESRTWEVAGAKVDGVFVRSQRDTVEIMGLDGKRTKAKLTDLSPADRTIVQDELTKIRELRKRLKAESGSVTAAYQDGTHP